MSVHVYSNQEKYEWKLQIYYEYYDNFCNDEAIFRQCEHNKNGGCKYDHCFHLWSSIDTKQFDGIICKVFIICDTDKQNHGLLLFFIATSVCFDGTTFEQDPQLLYHESLEILQKEYNRWVMMTIMMLFMTINW